MRIKQLLHTIRHLRPVQIWHQLKYRMVKPPFAVLEAPKGKRRGLQVEPIPRNKSLEGGKFCFLNLEQAFAGWDFTEFGNLWTYNQNYFDWLNQEGMTAEEGWKWIDAFIGDVLKCPVKPGMTMDPYPMALRSINWIKFFCRYPETATQERLDALYSQVRLLEKKLEYHLLANHLLEDAFALYIGSLYFGDERLLPKARRLLLEQLQEQILPDGAHFEQSPMYHCILLDRLLDCINIGGKTAERELLVSFAERMLGHLQSIVWSDGRIPLLNDAVYGIAPDPEQLFDYAKRLGIRWEAIAMKECGYRKMRSERMEAIVDVGNITATYQPGHSHADSLTYELRVDGKPFVVDTGISTYNKNGRRQLERSTLAHNCVSPGGLDSSEVWDGFRVGNRCRTEMTADSGTVVAAVHNGFSKPCRRQFEMNGSTWSVDDWYAGEAVSYVHLAEGVSPDQVRVEGAMSIEIKPWQYSTEYNRFREGVVLEIRFLDHVKYSIRG